MDIDFLVQDTYALVRPQWKVATELSDAMRLFSEAVAVNYKQTAQDKTAAEVDEEGEDSASDEANDEDGMPDINDADSLSEEADVGLILEITQSKANFEIRTMQKKSWPTKNQGLKRNRFLSPEKKNSLTPKLKLTSIKHLKE